METIIHLQEILDKLGIDIETVESIYYSHLSDQLIVRHTDEDKCETCGETL